ncbi:unnamed protein product [Lactuca saligna]|uniref:Uncharacterized protein n=1 Tax=Lactuca saligna TaxID=75948 RepID=A0AA35UUZ7_LACSI|nr:unnamed protein product [Lactuca saligna]
MFSTTTFRKEYNYRISPMNSSDMWPETNYTPPLPPINRRMPGRPTTKRKKSTTENIGTHRGSRSEPQQHEEVEMTPIEMDTTQNDIQVAPTDVEPIDVVEEVVVVEQAVQDEETEEVDPVFQVDNVNVQEVDEVNPNAQVDNGNVQEVAPVSQVQQVSVRPIS